MKVISYGIKLSYKTKGATGEFIELLDLYEIPELGGDVDKIEVTTLADAAHTYTNGLLNYGDSITFKFYVVEGAEQFKTLSALTDECDWKCELPEGIAYTFSGTPSIKLDGVSYNNPLTYSLNIAPTSEMVVA